MPRRVLLAILMPMLLLVVGSRFAARGADAPATQPATTGESVLAAESPHEAVATRPTTWLTLDGGDGDVLYRGWPIRIELHTATTAPTTPTVTITIRGPADISPHPAPDAPGVWLITPENSTAMPAGKYVVSVGTALADIVLADEPPTLSPAQQEAKQIARASYALALGDLPGAERLARDWAAASPASPAAQTTLGDVLAESGKPTEALSAYTEAINLTPPGTRPPADLLARASALHREIRASSTTRPSTTTTTTAPAADSPPTNPRTTS
jgi:hypothetical protein